MLVVMASTVKGARLRITHAIILLHSTEKTRRAILPAEASFPSHVPTTHFAFCLHVKRSALPFYTYCNHNHHHPSYQHTQLDRCLAIGAGRMNP